MKWSLILSSTVIYMINAYIIIFIHIYSLSCINFSLSLPPLPSSSSSLSLSASAVFPFWVLSSCFNLFSPYCQTLWPVNMLVRTFLCLILLFFNFSFRFITVNQISFQTSTIYFVHVYLCSIYLYIIRVHFSAILFYSILFAFVLVLLPFIVNNSHYSNSIYIYMIWW